MIKITAKGFGKINDASKRVKVFAREVSSNESEQSRSIEAIKQGLD